MATTDMSLLGYLRQVAKTQGELIVLQNSINMIDRQYSKLGVRYQIKQPSGSNPYEESKILTFFTYLFLWAFYTFIIAFPLMLIVGLFGFRLPILHEHPILRFLATDLIISGILAIPCNIMLTNSSYRGNKIEWDNYQNQILSQENRIRNENVLKEHLAEQRQELIYSYNETQGVLQRLYNVLDSSGHLILYPKYRDLVPVTMFIEYLDSGRCSRLEGHEGAYNIYENEARLNLIITKLDVIIQQLDVIRENQYYLYQTLVEIDRKSDSICQELKNMSSSLSTTEFYSEITASNTSALAMIEGFRVLKHGI